MSNSWSAARTKLFVLFVSIVLVGCATNETVKVQQKTYVSPQCENSAKYARSIGVLKAAGIPVDELDQYMTNPPSTIKYCPVIWRAQSDAKKRTAPATSSGRVTRRRGVEERIRSNTSGVVFSLARVVSRRPPATVFTVILWAPRSAAKVRVKPIKAALAAV